MFEGGSDEDVEELSDRLKASTMEGREGEGSSGRTLHWSEADMTIVTPCLSVLQVRQLNEKWKKCS